jgi:hypothetical protein
MYATIVALNAAMSTGHGPASVAGGGKFSRDLAIAFVIRTISTRAANHTSGNETAAAIAAMA